ncbi:MAG: potassium transporter TrkG, partial [Nannocystaceae bacterium]
AGFNSVGLVDVQPETLSVMLAWMLIGGAPGGTAGGIKVTTVAVIGLVVVNSVRGRWGAEAFGRRLSPQIVYKSLVITVVAGAAIFVANLCLLLTQAMPASVAIFEVVSALGTVGLTIGGTSALDSVGRAVIIVCMFVGRVGALSILMLLREEWTQGGLERPLEDVDIG